MIFAPGAPSYEKVFDIRSNMKAIPEEGVVVRLPGKTSKTKVQKPKIILPKAGRISGGIRLSLRSR